MLQFNVVNVGNVGREIYVWHRNGKTLSLFKDKTFYPYFYQVSPTGIFRTIDGQKVNKVLCSRPSDLSRRKDENSYEADVNFCKRYIIDKVTSFGKADIKYSFIDIEVLTKELPNYLYPEQPISCISCSNNYTGEIKTFSMKDLLDKDVQMVGEHAEEIILNDFVDFIKKEQFDLLLGWNFIDFDWRYLQARYKKLFDCELAEMLSPIAQSRYLGNSRGEVIPNLTPVGISIMDYLEMYKKIYRTESSYALDFVCQKELGESSYKKVDFSKLTDEIKEKNINDVRRMIEIDKKLKIIDYYDELRRMSTCEWSDVTWNSKMLDVILLREAKQKGIVLPSKHYGEGQDNPFATEETFQGAYRRCDTGLYKNIWKLDLSSAYPMAIINFCLDIANIRQNEGVTINRVRFYQNSGALLPTIAQKLINKKDILKKQLKSTNPETEEYKDLQTKYDAIKAVVNSLFGVCGLKIFRLFDYRIAASITFLIRDLLHYIEDELKKRSINVIYIDTDSVFIDSKDNPLELCNELVNNWAKEKYNKDKVGIEFDLEGQFEKLFVIALCHYKGYLKTKSGLKEEIKGIEAKRKDSSIFIKKFQEVLIEKIMNEEPKEEIIKWINSEKERIKTLPLIDIGYPCRISKETGSYKSIPIFLRGLEYTQELIKFEKVTGDSFYWINVKPFGKAIRKSSRNKSNKETGEKELQFSEKEVNKDVLCFDEENYEHIKEVDWDKIINKSIIDKTEHIFEALKWDFTEIKPAKVKRERKKKDVK
jgi:DNA polymerase elongation subunit (family B)